jgi:hypothetical protein
MDGAARKRLQGVKYRMEAANKSASISQMEGTFVDAEMDSDSMRMEGIA